MQSNTKTPAVRGYISINTPLGDLLDSLVLQARAANKLCENRVTAAAFLAEFHRKQEAFDAAMKRKVDVSCFGWCDTLQPTHEAYGQGLEDGGKQKMLEGFDRGFEQGFEQGRIDGRAEGMGGQVGMFH
ncbi:hypothetical protein CC86DRAFT_413490 [Ophiobolus disseminans]|uniref:Essential protein Yae1 N-terminal domain-containing protein n=1 Tax=Ophiobolus disseminans TaxID=1469910 RepID=A0A6A6ZEU0_9PLEO|nr:hypothetical protein CC86DRAFT_413490 [Ophiobolus disseminans]